MIDEPISICSAVGVKKVSIGIRGQPTRSTISTNASVPRHQSIARVL